MANDPTSQVPVWAWITFGLVVLAMLALDLWAFRGDRVDSRKAIRGWAVGWIALGLGFGALVWILLGGGAVQEYYATYAIEEGLSLDNLFLFYVIFQSLNVPRAAQHNVLFWGVLGAIVLRGLFIFLGVAAVEHWAWVSYAFGALLLFAAVQAFRRNPAEQEGSAVVEWLSEHLPVTSDVEHRKFIARADGRRVATPLLIALIAIETTDVLLAIDSVPAALSITHERFVVYTSNIFAIMGLRALYLYLAAAIKDLPYLHYGLAVVLVFAAAKSVTDEWLPVPAWASIAVVGGVMATAVWASVRTRKEREPHADHAAAR